ncbi:MAG: hypothetical protein WC469_04960 [Candidatus Omnitrophota bacterium]
MNQALKSKAAGLVGSLSEFYDKMADFDVNGSNLSDFSGLICGQMKELGFDSVRKDKAGNIIGVIKGYENKEAVLIMSHIDIKADRHERLEGPHKSGVTGFKAGVVSGIYAGALIKRALLPLTGDLVVCCLPRTESCDFGIKQLFEVSLEAKAKKIKGVILSEPTDFNVNLGHKGRMEYEIVVRGRLVRNFLQHRGINMLGTMFPLINELEKVSRELPSDSNLGRSDLRIKDVRYNGYQPQEELSEFRIVVDRVFIPEEDENLILNKAKTIAKNVYKSDSDVTVNAVLAKERVRTYTGMDILSEKDYKPWIMEAHQEFARASIDSITENGFKSAFGYWKKIVTDGSYTYAQLKIPTIGFGAGSEEGLDTDAASLGADKVERAAYGQALMVQRNIGLPTFGWSSDEI